ncbi:hypothetical protein NA56DRAFT_338765 [Hyaloscypha hepaticicola]|uniref:Uncharacterized protein n=1 Tax=Hyaloscypha hepaticicola TaxID=2082293 RepID=A0A2J6QIT8_9HELO|nr:hypothetical protein NA56DRAFT_338765 [Hyaloscypha hepaticicola]
MVYAAPPSMSLFILSIESPFSVRFVVLVSFPLSFLLLDQTALAREEAPQVRVCNESEIFKISSCAVADNLWLPQTVVSSLNIQLRAAKMPVCFPKSFKFLQTPALFRYILPCIIDQTPYIPTPFTYCLIQYIHLNFIPNFITPQHWRHPSPQPPPYFPHCPYFPSPLTYPLSSGDLFPCASPSSSPLLLFFSPSAPFSSSI